MKKNRSNISIVKNSYCVVLENAEKRTQGADGQRVEGYDSKIPYYVS